jgi:UDP-2,3-diacylglucosamine pyrophosphatase LpxH
MRTKFRTVWLSDTHLGSKGCQADELARFLKRIDCERLYLVGDIVDFWRLRRGRSHWPQNHNEVVRRILKLVKRGTEVIYVPGNHDEALREYAGMEFGGIVLRLNDVHVTADGRKLFVTHGDQFDLVVKHSRLLSLVGSAAYEWLIYLNRRYNQFRQWRGKPYWSLSQYIKLKVKSACTYVSRFEDTLLQEAKERGLDGVVCGHIHKPELIEAIDVPNGLSYLNCGDWIENCTALVEYQNGEIELLDARSFIEQHDAGHDVEALEAFLNDDGDPDLEPLLDGYADRSNADCAVDWQLAPMMLKNQKKPTA